jgi:flagellar basal body-associated protein FliL
MKLCPQCDFIYEDEQTVCDMDGKELVSQSPVVETPGATSPSASAVPTRGAKRWVALAAVVALLLAVIAIAYLWQSGQKRVYAADSAIPPVASEVKSQPPPLVAATPGAVDSPSVAERDGAPPATPEASAQMLTKAVAATATNAAANNSKRVIIRLTNGSRITAEDAWPGKNGIWYRQGGMVTFLKQSQIKAIDRVAPANTNSTDKTPKSSTQAAAAPNPLRLKRLEPATVKRPSRVTSFLRKTGDILKKPFKL